MHYDEEDALWNLLNDQRAELRASSEDVPAPALAPVAAHAGAQAGCEYCGHDRTLCKDGIVACAGCGTVVERTLDEAAEWRSFGDIGGGKDLSRCGAPVNELLPVSSLSVTLCGYGGRGVWLAKQYNMWASSTYRERTLYRVFETITLCARDKGIPQSIVEQAKVLYKCVSEKRIMRGGMRQAFVAASVYMACKIHLVPRSAKEIAGIFGINVALMNRGCKCISQLLAIPVASTTAADLVGRMASSLHLSCAAKQQCVALVACAEELGVAPESTPSTLAAACVFLASVTDGLGVDKARLAAASGVSASTINRCYNKLVPAKDVLLRFASGQEEGRDFRQASAPITT